MCAFGSRCYRRNPEHFRESDHPSEHPLIGHSRRPEAEAGLGSAAASISGVKRPREARGDKDVIILDDDGVDDKVDGQAGRSAHINQRRDAATWLHGSVDYAPQLAELEAMGFRDVRSNQFALDASGGDLTAALELLIQCSGCE